MCKLAQLLLFLFHIRDFGRCWRSSVGTVLREIKSERWSYNSWCRMRLGITGFIRCKELQEFQGYRNLQFHNSESLYWREVPVCCLLVATILIKQITLTRKHYSTCKLNIVQLPESLSLLLYFQGSSAAKFGYHCCRY